MAGGTQLGFVPAPRQRVGQRQILADARVAAGGANGRFEQLHGALWVTGQRQREAAIGR